MKTTLIYFGGPDSTVLLYDLFNRGHAITAQTFHIGDRERAASDNKSPRFDELRVGYRLANVWEK